LHINYYFDIVKVVTILFKEAYPMMRLMRFLSGFIVGMSLGAAIVMLFAPESGAEIRERLRGQVEVILEEGRRAADQTRTDAQARLSELKAGTGQVS
jgi:gas vesicle protein